jgi:eukaryotic-like serine/threonine-protein kinase
VLSATKREGEGPAAQPTRFDPVPGTVVDGKYRVEKVLGEGGMGLVVSAVHLGLEQEVAIKFLLPEAMRNKVAVERFLREAKVAAKVRSEHVARVHDVGTLEEGGVPYIVMERLEGLDLGKLIDREGALPIDEACEIALQACEALSEVHAAGIVHRDLKPSNLFVTRKVDGSPSVKLLDFGISKLTSLGGDEPGLDPALTQTATIMGSPSYMSPEQLKSTKEVDKRADVWSLGAVLYEAITGKPAFRGESLPQVCAMIASEDPALPSTRRDGIPIELERTVLRCLEKDPDGRAPLVELARTLARYAPDRAKASLERIEATTGGPVASQPRARVATYAEKGRSESPSMATRSRVSDAESTGGHRSGRTMSSWGRDRRGKRGGSGAVLLLLAASGLAAVAVYSGRIGVMKLSGDLGGAASAVSSAAGAVSSAVSAGASAVSAGASAVASSLPPIPPLPPLPGMNDEPAGSASVGASGSASASPSGSASAEAEQGEPGGSDEPGDEPAASEAASAGAAPQAHPAAHKAKPKHHGKTKKHHP